jgi:glycerol uptake facilitator protein
VNGNRSKAPVVAGWFVGEFTGTFLLVLFGCGSVATAVLTGAFVGVFQVALLWGIGIAVAIHLTGSLSGAHLNPAITIAFATWTDFPWRKVPGYIGAQLAGAFVASGVLYVVFSGSLQVYETAHHITRGASGSEATAMIFGEFFPNPGGQALAIAARASVSSATAFMVEALGTGILVLVIFGSVDDRNRSRPRILTAAVIGLTITILIALFSPLTMAAFNPARDFAPRVFSSLAGWNGIPFSTNGWGWLTVYIVAPITGALLGGGIYHRCFRPHHAATTVGE